MADKVKTALLLGVCVNWPCWAFFIFGKTVKNENSVFSLYQRFTGVRLHGT